MPPAKKATKKKPVEVTEDEAAAALEAAAAELAAALDAQDEQPAEEEPAEAPEGPKNPNIHDLIRELNPNYEVGDPLWPYDIQTDPLKVRWARDE